MFRHLKPILNDNRTIVFLCIGTDRSTGDSLGPLIGYKLRLVKNKNIRIYGSLEKPIHSNNLCEILDKIKTNFKSPFIITVNARLDTIRNVGKVFIENKPLYACSLLGKNVLPIGDMNISGIVNLLGNSEFMTLQNTRLYNVMSLADSISSGIYYFILKSVGNKKLNSIDLSPINLIIK